MRKNKHAVVLTDNQRMKLEQLFAEALPLPQRNRVQVLLRSDAGEPDADIADELGSSAGTVANIRKRFAAEGLETALTEKPCQGGPAMLDEMGRRSSSSWPAALLPKGGRCGRPR